MRSLVLCLPTVILLALAGPARATTTALGAPATTPAKAPAAMNAPTSGGKTAGQAATPESRPPGRGSTGTTR